MTGTVVRRMVAISAAFFALMLGGPAAVLMSGKADLDGDWRSASRASAGLAPDPAQVEEAVLQVYSARAFAWRGAFAVHSWIAAKPAGADRYTRYEAIGWRSYDGLSPVAVRPGTPDSAWYGSPPRRLADLRGAAAKQAIAEIDAAVESYPYADSYRAWPGPNSNTFTAYLLRASETLDLPMDALGIGKDYGPGFVSKTPSGTGVRLGARGLAGVNAGLAEGLELVLLGQTLGVDIQRPALKLPGIGRVGMARPDPAALPPPEPAGPARLSAR